MRIAGSSTTLLGPRLIISLAGCVIIERPLASVWISRLRRLGVRSPAGFTASLRAAQAVIGCSGTLDLRHGNTRNNRETECGGAAYDNFSHLRASVVDLSHLRASVLPLKHSEKIGWRARTQVRYAITRRGLSQHSHGRTRSGHVRSRRSETPPRPIDIIFLGCLETSLRGGREIRVRRVTVLRDCLARRRQFLPGRT